MLRQPASSKERTPSCFSTSFARAKAICRRCPLASRCAPLSRAWGLRRSLSEQLAEAEREALAPSYDVTTLERIYDHQYREVFGRQPRRKRSARNDAIFGRLLSLCVSEDIDPATFIAANMHGMREFVASSTYGFQPNMLSGERARGRYNAFIRQANRRYGRGLGDVLVGRTEVGKLRRTLVFDETAVGDLFVRYRWIGTPVTWSHAADLACASSLWLDFDRRRGAQYQDWLARLGEKALDKERKLSQLRAAVAVADGFRSGLSDLVGVNDFSWDALADFVVSTFDRPSRSKLNLTGIAGELWR